LTYTFSFGPGLNVCSDLYIDGRKILIKQNIKLDVKLVCPIIIINIVKIISGASCTWFNLPPLPMWFN